MTLWPFAPRLATSTPIPFLERDGHFANYGHARFSSDRFDRSQSFKVRAPKAAENATSQITMENTKSGI
jgi:hypothetical protein